MLCPSLPLSLLHAIPKALYGQKKRKFPSFQPLVSALRVVTRYFCPQGMLTLLIFSIQRLKSPHPCTTAVDMEPSSTGPKGFHFSKCYFHRDLQCRLFYRLSRVWLLTIYTLSYLRRELVTTCSRSIFWASTFGRWVVTHSLVDSYFHGHPPAVKMHWPHLIDVALRTLSRL